MQIFHRSTNTISRATIFGAVFLIAFVLWACIQFQRSPYVTYARVARPQPVPFSHQHHVAGLGIDCRYCHTSVEKSSFAGIPPTKTCMNCHSQIWVGAPLLEPVRESFRSGKSLVWTRVNDLPDFVYFDHSIHINKGVGCNTCHGPVDRMPLMFNYASLQMEWCLDCHRDPAKYLRPRDQVFNMRYDPPSSLKPLVLDGKQYTDQLSLGLDLVKKYNLRTERDITSCSTCHR
jgi:Cytochrome c7 and related cytochrome c